MYRDYLRSDKWRDISRERMEIDEYKCVMCGCYGTKQNPLEVHHLSYKYLYQEENRVHQDLVTLCHCCHKNVHALMNRKTDTAGHRGWKDNRSIPKVHVFNMGGTTDFIEKTEV
jgi:5-methylcytosine-specific restriction endonuclease McrA